MDNFAEYMVKNVRIHRTMPKRLGSSCLQCCSALHLYFWFL